MFSRSLSRLLLALCPNITSSNFLFPARFSVYYYEHFASFSCIILKSVEFKRYLIFLLWSGGIQFATAQLPSLELMDCGMSICDPNMDDVSVDESNDNEPQKSSKLHHIYQKLIVKHSRLKKLSLWGCSGLDVSSWPCKDI